MVAPREWPTPYVGSDATSGPSARTQRSNLNCDSSATRRWSKLVLYGVAITCRPVGGGGRAEGRESWLSRQGDAAAGEERALRGQ